MIWDMLCPKCESDNYYHPDMQFEGDIIMAHFICIDCGHGFDVIFDNPILINEQERGKYEIEKTTRGNARSY